MKKAKRSDRLIRNVTGQRADATLDHYDGPDVYDDIYNAEAIMNVGGRCLFDPNNFNPNSPNETLGQNLNNQRDGNMVQNVNYQRDEALVQKLENQRNDTLVQVSNQNQTPQNNSSLGEDVMNQQSTSGLGNK